jgi:hypothetical protein
MVRNTDTPDDEHTPRPAADAPPPAPNSAEPAEAAEIAPSGDDGRSVFSTIAGAAGPVISAALRPVGELTSGARRAFDTRPGARVRRVRQMGRQPLPNMWELYPEAHRAALRELGLRTIPVDEIAGTAVEGQTQRGGDFLPLRQLRGRDWRARWQRILSAIDRLVSLPPIDVLKLGDRYWVVDGHNRVAAALYTGQIGIDANVVELRLPGMRSEAAPSNLAPFLEQSRDVRAAGSGRLTRTTMRPESVMPAHPLHEHADEDSRRAQDHGGAEDAAPTEE